MKVRRPALFRPALFACVLMTLWVLYSPGFILAQTGIGVWVRQPGPATPGDMTMTVEACCSGGRRLTYNFKVGNNAVVMIVESPFNGTDVPVLVGGKPSAETMAIKLIDDHHTTTVLKMNGQSFGTSKATLSADGKTLTVENNITFAAGGQTPGIQTEVWKKK